MICTIGIMRWDTEETLQKEIAQQVLRFHVRANSNTEQDQKIKMKVKNAVVEYLQQLLDDSASIEETRLLTENHFPEIKKIIHETLGQEGCSYGFQIAIKEESFPKKTYGDCTFPQGVYEALIISLGSGRGNNWWCMLYPSLCFLDETCGIVTEEKKEELAGLLTEDAYEWILEGKPVRIRFRINWLNDFFGLYE